ncbi:MAG: YkvA family protein [Myxococcota bacterium]
MAEDIVTIELNPRERRLYDRVRAAVSRMEPGGAFTIRDVVLLMPDLTVLLARLLRDRRVPLGAKAVALFGVGYVLSPIDLLPAVFFGPVGWVDDALVVTAALGRILNDVHPDIVRSHWSGTGDALDAIQRITHWSHSLVAGRLRRAMPGRSV